MSALRVSSIIGACGALVACAQLVGIGDFPGATDASSDDAGDGSSVDAPSSLCTNAVLTSSQPVARVDTSSGFVFVQGGGFLARCEATGACNDPPLLLQLGSSDLFQSASVGASIAYTIDDTSAGGSIRSAALDGTGATTLLTTPGRPDQIAMSGSRIFWVDDATVASSVVHCIGCTGPGLDAPWITSLDTPLALFADVSSVYALAYDSSGSTLGIFGCGASAACASAPRTVITGLAALTKAPNVVASDGAAVYVGRLSDIARIDSLGDLIQVVQDVAPLALAVDGVAHEIAYAQNSGEIDVASTDGSLTHRTLSMCAGTVISLAIDATNVYVLVSDATLSHVYAIKR